MAWMKREKDTDRERESVPDCDIFVSICICMLICVLGIHSDSGVVGSIFTELDIRLVF